MSIKCQFCGFPLVFTKNLNGIKDFVPVHDHCLKIYKRGKEAERLRTIKKIDALLAITKPYEECGLAKTSSNETTTKCAECVLENLKNKITEPEKEEAKK